MFRRLRRDRRGISNVIVVVLSLVIILAIVSNIVLWNYEMNQVDWEKMKEIHNNEINEFLAEKIISYRTENGPYERFDILLTKNIIDRALYNRLLSYLTLWE